MDSIFVYKYCVEYWDEINNKTNTESGIVFGSTFTEAACRLEKYYGKNNVLSIRELTGFDVSGNYLIPEDAFEDLGYTLSKKESN